MKIAIYSENLLQSSGGAEVYALLLANALKQKHTVVIYTIKNDTVQIEDVFKKYNVPLLTVKTVLSNKKKGSISQGLNDLYIRMQLEKTIKRNFDLFINCSCNRMPGIKGVKSIHLIHFPGKNYTGKVPFPFSNYLNNRYKKSYAHFLVNSNFTKGYLKEYWGVTGDILYPPIQMTPITVGELKNKENIILVVGRIVPDKKISDLVTAYKKLIDKYNYDYKLVIIGNKDSEYEAYYSELLDKKESYNIELLNDISYFELLSYYKISKIFWHARGFMAENEDPFYMEHFGMTTVEAMANGCIPVVINKAGQKEIIESASGGYLWNTLDELIEKTVTVIKSKSLEEMQMAVVDSSKQYLIKNFTQKALMLIEEFNG